MHRWFLVLIGLLLVMNAGPPPSASAQQVGIDRAIAVQEAHNPALLNLPGVVGTGVGLNGSGGAVIRVYLESAAVRGVPPSLDNVPVEAVVTGLIFAQGCENNDPQKRCDRPVPIGVSTGHPDITAGTIGARVVDGSGNVYALSNNHVYAKSNDAKIGDPVIQPGSYDGGKSPQDDIGSLAAFVPIKFDGSENLVDAAIASSTTTNLGNSTLPGGYGTPSSTILACQNDACANVLNQPVQKYGRTTGATQGTVAEVNVTVTVCYSGFIFCTKSAKFVKQLSITPGSFSSGGDSGSLIVTDDSDANPVGLLFAGSSTRTIANRIDHVLSAFGVTIDDSASSSDPAPPPSEEEDTEAPSAPSGLSATAVSSSRIDLEWIESSDNVGVAGYEIHRDDGLIATVGGTTTSYSDTGLSASTAYTYKVRAFDAAGNLSSYSSPATATTLAAVESGVGVESITYSTNGGRLSDMHLNITLTVKDSNGNLVSGASVSIALYRNGLQISSGTGTSSSDGTVTFSLKNAASGCYTTVVTNLVAAGLTWDGITPDNSFEKGASC